MPASLVLEVIVMRRGKANGLTWLEIIVIDLVVLLTLITLATAQPAQPAATGSPAPSLSAVPVMPGALTATPRHAAVHFVSHET